MSGSTLTIETDSIMDKQTEWKVRLILNSLSKQKAINKMTRDDRGYLLSVAKDLKSDGYQNFEYLQDLIKFRLGVTV